MHIMYVSLDIKVIYINNFQSYYNAVQSEIDFKQILILLTVEYDISPLEIVKN